MRRRSWVGLLACATLSLLAHLPASLLDARIAAMSDGRWRLSAASGTVWQGQGQLLYHAAGGEVLPMSTLAWQWQPAALWSLAWQWQLWSDGTPGQLRWQGRQLAVQQFALQLPVAALSSFSPKWQSARLGGQLQLQLAHAQLGPDGVRAQGSLQWLAAVSPLSPLQPFGSYALEVEGDSEPLRLRLRTLQGPLQLQGQGSYAAGRLQLAGTAGSDAAQYEALKPVLLMLGQPDQPYGVRWQLN